MFGGNRTNAATVGELLQKCRWVGIPFAGGMPELKHINASTIVVSDLHRHIINLAQVVASPEGKAWLISELGKMTFHPDSLATAQKFCLEWDWKEFDSETSAIAALYYFTSQWMGRSGKSGTVDEFRGSLPVRWNSNGGDSNKRFRSAVEAIDEFHRIMQRCNFVCIDCFEFLAKCPDDKTSGIFVDPPWPEAGDAYLHSVEDDSFHKHLRDDLNCFERTRIVVRYGDHPLIRSLYKQSNGWTIHELEGRKQSPKSQPELMIVRN